MPTTADEPRTSHQPAPATLLTPEQMSPAIRALHELLLASGCELAPLRVNQVTHTTTITATRGPLTVHLVVDAAKVREAQYRIADAASKRRPKRAWKKITTTRALTELQRLLDGERQPSTPRSTR